jgi:hypothetical protein
MASQRDNELAAKAKAYGANYSLRIVMEARRAGIAVSLAFAIVEMESGGKNIWGHDPPPNGGTSNLGGMVVTKAAYQKYKQTRGSTGRGGMQGVGPCQLTWYEKQDRADTLGGCWVARHNIAVAFHDLAALIDAHGERAGIKAYNGTGAAADRYAATVLVRKSVWHRRLA